MTTVKSANDLHQVALVAFPWVRWFIICDNQ